MGYCSKEDTDNETKARLDGHGPAADTHATTQTGRCRVHTLLNTDGSTCLPDVQHEQMTYSQQRWTLYLGVEGWHSNICWGWPHQDLQKLLHTWQAMRHSQSYPMYACKCKGVERTGNKPLHGISVTGA